MEVIPLTTSKGGGFRLVPKTYRRRLYRRHKAYWFWALIRYSRRGPAGELRSIRGYRGLTTNVSWPVRAALNLLIGWYLRTSDDPPPRNAAQRFLWEDDLCVRDTTSYEFPEIEVTFVPRLLGRRRDGE